MKLSHSILAAAIVFAAAPAFALESEPAAASMQHSDHCGLPMGEGSISALNVKASKATIDHAPIAALGWEAMTMDFKAAKTIDLSAFAAGDRVHFLLSEDTESKSYRIEAMCALDVSEGLHDACMGKMHETAVALAESGGKSCKMDGMSHDAMPGMDHTAMKGMDHGNMGGMKPGDMKPADAEAMSCKDQCPMMKKSSGAPEEPAPAQDHSQH
ncbi:MAG: copper resistance protein [Hyphomonas sp.]|uniref:copper-binding protein n=1 Tax=Hyphomonas sp. TaxID=87 RepID=UPI0017C94099|nr:copper-binding protein [Hyphomonas sp.]MBA3067566.1 copper resistance protein [Hyphomonas sp.]MBU3920110.1 copper-binding protein [Alphaproteobacteria bacterium]MBU4063455.1 copper-binding protein [Alphaproteobacteria bacterium]MBU4165276.1 copper-binding protein [Alphaproteobacteria bacterium]